MPVTGGGRERARDDEDTGIEDEPQRRGLMIPASMGLRCQVPDDLESFTVTASWGMYEPVTEEDAKTAAVRSGNTSAPQSRSPSGSQVADLHDGTTADDPAQGQGRAARRPVRRPRARLPADRDRAVQRPGDRRGRSRSTPGCTRPS